MNGDVYKIHQDAGGKETATLTINNGAFEQVTIKVDQKSYPGNTRSSLKSQIVQDIEEKYVTTLPEGYKISELNGTILPAYFDPSKADHVFSNSVSVPNLSFSACGENPLPFPLSTLSFIK